MRAPLANHDDHIRESITLAVQRLASIYIEEPPSCPVSTSHRRLSASSDTSHAVQAFSAIQQSKLAIPDRFNVDIDGAVKWLLSLSAGLAAAVYRAISKRRRPR